MDGKFQEDVKWKAFKGSILSLPAEFLNEHIKI